MRLITRLTGEFQRQAYKEIIDVTHETRDYWLFSLLMETFDKASNDLQFELFALVGEIDIQQNYKSEALIKISEFLTGELLLKAQNLASRYSYRHPNLASVIVAERMFSENIQRFSSIKIRSNKLWIKFSFQVLNLMPASSKLIKDFLHYISFSMLRGIKWKRYRITGLVELLKQCDKKLKDLVFRELYEEVEKLKDLEDRLVIMVDVSYYVEGNQKVLVFQEILNALRCKKHFSVEEYGILLKNILRRLPKEFVQEFLDIVKRVEHEWSRSELLMRIAPEWPTDLIDQLYDSIFTFSDEILVAITLAGTAPFLPEKYISEALAKAKLIKNDWARAQALIGLAPFLKKNQENVAYEALQTAQKAERPYTYNTPGMNLLAEIISFIEILGFSEIDGNPSLWLSLLSDCALSKRSDLLMNIEALAPLIYHLGGQDAILDTYYAILDVTNWWS